MTNERTIPGTRCRNSYLSCQSELPGFAPTEPSSVAPDLDLYEAASIVLGALAKVEKLRSLLFVHKSFDPHKLDRIGPYALALVYLESQCRALDSTGSANLSARTRECDAALHKVILGLPAEQRPRAIAEPSDNLEVIALEMLSRSLRVRPAIERLVVEHDDRTDDLYAVYDAEFQAELVLAVAQHQTPDPTLLARYRDERARLFSAFDAAYEKMLRPCVEYVFKHKHELDRLAFTAANNYVAHQLANEPWQPKERPPGPFGKN